MGEVVAPNGGSTGPRWVQYCLQMGGSTGPGWGKYWLQMGMYWSWMGEVLAPDMEILAKLYSYTKIVCCLWRYIIFHQ